MPMRKDSQITAEQIEGWRKSWRANYLASYQAPDLRACGEQLMKICDLALNGLERPSETFATVDNAGQIANVMKRTRQTVLEEAAKEAESGIGAPGPVLVGIDEKDADDIRDAEARRIATSIRTLLLKNAAPQVPLTTGSNVDDSAQHAGSSAPAAAAPDVRKCKHGKWLYERCIPCEPVAATPNTTDKEIK